MAEKHLVCQGAICICKFGKTPDKLKVLSQTQKYINDPDGAKKLLVTTMDLGPTFEKNTFGSCTKQNNNPCIASVMEWKGCYEEVTLANGGKILLEDSKATCPVGGAGCIEIIFHGQVAEMGAQNEENADEEVLVQLYPFGELKKASEPLYLPIE